MRVDPATGKRRFAPPVGVRRGKKPPPEVPPTPERQVKGEVHPPELRLRARAIYVYDKRPLVEAAMECGVTAATVARWKAFAKSAGDDWELARELTSLTSGNRALLLNALLEDFLKQYRGTIGWLDKAGPELTALDRAHSLSRLAQALEKVTDCHKRLQPEQNRLALALDTLRDLVAYLQDADPALAAGLLAHLEPFGEQIASRYAKAD